MRSPCQRCPLTAVTSDLWMHEPKKHPPTDRNIWQWIHFFMCEETTFFIADNILSMSSSTRDLLWPSSRNEECRYVCSNVTKSQLCPAVQRSTMTLPKCLCAALTGLRPPSRWQQPVSVSSSILTVSRLTGLLVSVSSHQLGAAGSGRINLAASTLARLGSLFSRRPVEAWGEEASFKNVLTDRRTGRRPRVGWGRAPLAALNWIHFRVSLSAVPSLLSSRKYQMLFLFFFFPSQLYPAELHTFVAWFCSRSPAVNEVGLM